MAATAPLHLLKIAVGIESVEHLAEVQAARVAQRRASGEAAELRHITRHAPRRGGEIVIGGSIYWIIKRFVRVRQCIRRIDLLSEPINGKRCALVLDAELVRTRLQGRRPHQGWRYLDAKDAPADLPTAVRGEGDLPPELESELRALGLL